MNKKRILFLSDTSSFGEQGSQRYIGPYVVANSLEKQGYNCVVIDYITRHNNLISYLEDFITEDTIMLGISSTFISPLYTHDEIFDPNALALNVDRYNESSLQFRDTKDFEVWLNALRTILNKKAPRCKIIVGGAKVQSLLDKESKHLKEIDYFFWGQADSVIPIIADCLSRNVEPVTIPVNGHNVIDTLKQYQIIKSCPDFDWKPHWSIQHNEALPMEISRGCIFNCKFCHYDKKESFKKELTSLRNELIDNYERFGTTFYHFCDDCFNDSRIKVEAVCGMLKELPFKIEWVSYARVDVAVKFPHTAQLMVESGARGLHWGIESLTESVAKRVGKGTPIESVKKFLTGFYKDFGDQCLVQGSFITGLPGETHESQRENINWVVNNEAFHFITVGPLKLFPYRPSFDGVGTDFSDYSRNPEKYGFSEISFSPANWVHSTMNQKEAMQYSGLFFDTWKKSSPKRDGPLRTVWNYPHMRSLGFNGPDLNAYYFTTEGQQRLSQVAIERFNARNEKYFQDLKKNNC